MGVDAFEDLYARHFDAVYGYLRVMLGTSDAAEEAVQDVFAHAFHAGRTRSHDVRPWLFSIARAAVLARGCSRDGALDDGVSDPELMHLVHDLPDLERETVVLRYLIGLSVREIARVIGRRRVAVRLAHRRALRALQHRAGRDAGAGKPVPVLAGAAPG